MPIWLYEVRPLYAGLFLVVTVETVSIVGLVLVRNLFIRRLRYHEGANDAVSGTVQAIGVFYGITVGLIAAGVWNTNTNAADLVSQEAVAIGALYRDVSAYPAPLRDELRAKMREYTVFVIEQAWPAQKQGRGQDLDGGTKILDDFQGRLYTFEPATNGQMSLHNETLKAYNSLIEHRRLRIDAVNTGLSTVMWVVIWLGAAISIGVAYFFNVPDQRLHTILIALISGFLALVLLMIIINDKPFYGYVSISPDPYKLILNRMIDVVR
jgi:hypothetical protein